MNQLGQNGMRMNRLITGGTIPISREDFVVSLMHLPKNLNAGALGNTKIIIF
jgi:hypothetical protein